MLLNLVENLLLLMVFGLGHHFISRWVPRTSALRDLLVGLIFGVGAVVSMLNAFQLATGVIFDARTVMISLAGLFGGPGGGVTAILIAGAWRAHLGGLGVLAGLATIVSAGLLGMLARHLLRDRWPPSWQRLWLFSLTVHLVALACMFLLPFDLAVKSLRQVTVPFLVLLPLVGVLLGMLLASAERAQEQITRLRHSDWLFGEAQQLINFGCWEYDVQSDVATATAQFFRIHDLPEKTRGHSLQDTLQCLHVDDRERVRAIFMESLKSGEPFDLKARFISYAGTDRWIRLVGKPIVRAGKTRQMVGNLIDISKRMQTELALRASQLQLQAILDHAPALICICNVLGEVKLASQRFAKLDLVESNLVGKPLYEILPREKTLEQWLDDLVALQSGQRIEFEEALRHRDGSTHTYLTSKFLLGGESGDQVCYISTDISDLKRLATDREGMLAQLVEKNEELERFTYSISHDLKSPLVTICGFAELIGADVAAGRQQAVDEGLGYIREAAGKMRLLIDGLLELSRVGSKAGRFETISIQELMQNVQLLLHGALTKNPAELVVADDFPRIVGDALLLRQALQNLIENALKFRDAERPLQIVIGWFMADDGSVVVTVADNGQGIAPKDMERVFQLFEHGAGPLSGSGIGLSLVRSIMARHGGKVWAESAGPGTGTTFCLQFPFAAKN